MYLFLVYVVEHYSFRDLICPHWTVEVRTLTAVVNLSHVRREEGLDFVAFVHISLLSALFYSAFRR